MAASLVSGSRVWPCQKTDVTNPELDCVRDGMSPGASILANPEQKEKCHHDQISGGSGCRGSGGVHASGGCQFDGIDGQSHLGTWDGVASLEGLKDMGKGQRQGIAAGSTGASGVSVSFQHEGLCHMTQGFFDGLGSNLPTLPKVSSTSPGGKSQQ